MASARKGVFDAATDIYFLVFTFYTQARIERNHFLVIKFLLITILLCLFIPSVQAPRNSLYQK
jgi:hypothetical protein